MDMDGVKPKGRKKEKNPDMGNLGAKTLGILQATLGGHKRL